MRAKTHFKILAIAILVWFLFWLAGLPDYYQQHSPVWLGIGSCFITVLSALAGIYVLNRGQPARRLQFSIWLSFYNTVPFALLDYAYCGLYLNQGIAYLISYWYLSIFYLIPWLLFVPTAMLLQPRQSTKA